MMAVLIAAGCGRLDAIPYHPAQTPETWLRIQPFTTFELASQPILIVQPTTSAIVFLLGVVAIAAGLFVLRIRKTHQARLWWGAALILWGGGALLAGISYEAFSYQIKCAGREACLWTSWWEIGYLILSAASVDAMLVAQAYSCAAGKWRKILVRYAAANALIYTATVLVGAWLPVKFLISFELLLVVAAPNILIFLIQNGWRYSKYRQAMDLRLLGIWIGLVLIIAAYFLYYISGLTQSLWVQGIWFSENDVLHIGLILWMLAIAWIAAPKVEDNLKTN